MNETLCTIYYKQLFEIIFQKISILKDHLS